MGRLFFLTVLFVVIIVNICVTGTVTISPDLKLIAISDD